MEIIVNLFSEGWALGLRDEIQGSPSPLREHLTNADGAEVAGIGKWWCCEDNNGYWKIIQKFCELIVL